ncbi:MAG: GNAT family N-acetyltransferase [Pseudonocardiaceae bacterium]
MSAPAGVTLRHCNVRQAAALLDPICRLHDTVFSQPPFHLTDDESQYHRQSLISTIANPTFAMVTADAGGELVGYADGVVLKPDTQWWSGTTAPLPDELTAEWNGRTFAIIDLAVREDYRKRGIGRALLDTLLADRQEQRAALTVQLVAIDTKEFCEHLGWQRVGTIKAPDRAVSPFFDMYLLQLSAVGR